MFRFLRRVFILLVLFVIIFLVFRFVKPEATNRFVDKVKWIPTTISSRFHREKKSDIIINWNTTSTKSNFEINSDDEYYEWSYAPEIDNNNGEISNENNWDINDSSRLEELNRELDRIIASWNSQTEPDETSTESGWDIEEIVSWLLDNNEIPVIEITWNNQNTWFIVIDVEQPYEPERPVQTITQDDTNNTQSTTTTQTNNNTQTNNTQTNNNTSVQPKRWNCWSGLTVQDCEQLMRDLWNYN